MNHVMLDLETWGTLPGCAIRSIGACVFDPYDWSEPVVETFYRNVSTESQTHTSLTFSDDTVAWWRDTNRSEAAKVFADDRKPLGISISNFFEWFDDVGGKYLWCHGASFDEPIMRFAADAVFSCETPWHHHDVRDTRTLFMLADFDPKCVKMPDGFIKHHALHDAQYQVMQVQAAIKHMTTIFKIPKVYEFLTGPTDCVWIVLGTIAE